MLSAHAIWLLGKSEERFVLWATTARTREKNKHRIWAVRDVADPDLPAANAISIGIQKLILICIGRLLCACHFLGQLSHFYFQCWRKLLRAHETKGVLLCDSSLCCWRRLIFLIRTTDQLKERKTIIRSINQRDKMLSRLGSNPNCLRK
jgi:hypothetical protein